MHIIQRVQATRLSKLNHQKKRKAEKKASTGDESELEIDDKVLKTPIKQHGDSKFANVIHDAVEKAMANGIEEIKQSNKKSFTMLHTEIKELKEGIAFRDAEIQDLQDITDSLLEKFKEMEGRLIRCEKLNEDLREDSIETKTRSMRDNLIFYKIAEFQGQGQENCMALLKGFLQAEMYIDNSTMDELHFDRVHRLGARSTGHSRPIIVKCSDARTKELIYRHVRNLKGKPFGISDQVPPEVNEQRNHLFSKFKEAKDANQKPKWVGGKLVVNGKFFSKPKDQSDSSHTVPIQATADSIKHSEITSELGSSFQSHKANINDTAQVIPTLHQLYCNHSVAKATHNVYAYRIESNGKLVENSCDDGEHGAGRKLLNLLRELDAKNQLIVVTRWYGGQHMGPKRFNCILESARKILRG